MKKWIVAIGVTATMLTACSGNDTGSDSQVIVETDAGNITKEEFYNELKKAQGEFVLKEMITEKVLSEKYEVTDEEIENRINAMKDAYGAQYPFFLMQYGITDDEQLKEILRPSMLKEKAATEGIEISEDEMKEYYDTLKPQIRASHILLETKEEAEEILKKLNNGADFAELATEYSQDPGSKDNGGDLNFFGPGQMYQEFEDGAYALEVGEISEPIESPAGWHIIKLTDIEELEPFEEKKEEIRQILLLEKVDIQRADEIIAKYINESNVKILDKQFENLFAVPESAEEDTDNDQAEDNE